MGVRLLFGASGCPPGDSGTPRCPANRFVDPFGDPVGVGLVPLVPFRMSLGGFWWSLGPFKSVVNCEKSKMCIKKKSIFVQNKKKGPLYVLYREMNFLQGNLKN